MTAEPELERGTPAKLFRLSGFPGQQTQAGGPIEEGSLRDLLQVAMNDVDDLWRYSIVTLGRPLIKESDIRALAKEWDIRPA
ncbi:hypothetical protein [Sphingomonas sp. TREG-RG-20F-R18-01]|uniref:hypothetical protein n=1 Tax=Sphingomonas sp. TREG-RG-20F-R18-01 TaxID=2914982 RepID=UPI001F571107|nr:hypothetical protein [Sphingomonas sp. TREG-RG-20F-R18-01]